MPAARPQGPGAPPLILLGEDDDELRSLVTGKLRRHGCDVIEARTGPALAALVLERVVEPVSPMLRPV